MAEVSEELDKKLNLKTPTKRSELQELLNRIIEHAYSKFTNKFCKNQERLQWGRLIIQAANIQHEILASTELEDLQTRVKILEEKGGVKINE
jgi:hypothetical protein